MADKSALEDAIKGKNDEFYIWLFFNMFNINIHNSCTEKVA